MRPRSLDIHGFTSFREPQHVDFSPLELFVITGPTGAGKTSLLDAMAFALYGQVPRIGRHGLAELVTHGQAEARVALEFSVGGSVYRVSRRLPRRGAATAKLERHEDGEWRDATERGGVRAVNEAILALLKLDFASFCKAVVLPQGEFARFLKGEPEERRTTLVALLGLGSYQRMRELAGQRARELDIKTKHTTEILGGDEFAEATPAGLAAAEAAAETAHRHAHELTGVVATVRDQHRQLTDRAAARARAMTLTARIGELVARLEDEQQACRDAEHAGRRAQATCGPARERAGEAARALAEAERALSETTARVGTIEALTRLSGAAEALPRLDAERAAAQQLLERLAGDQAAVAREVADVEARRTTAGGELAAREADQAQAERDWETRSQERLGLERRLEDLRRLSAALETAEAAVPPAHGSLAQAQAAAAAAEICLREAEAAHRAMERRDMVGALVSGLGPGDPCPVCDRPLETHPSRNGHLSDELAAAARAGEEARRSADRLAREEAAAAARLQGIRRAAQTARASWHSACNGSAGLAAAESALAAASARLQEADAGRAGARAAAERARTATSELGQALAAATTRARELAVQEHHAQRALESTAGRERETLTLLHGRFGDTIPLDAVDRLAADRASIERAQRAVHDCAGADRASRTALAEAEDEVATAQRRLAELDVALEGLRGQAHSAWEAANTLDALVNRLPEPAPARDARAGELVAWCRAALSAVTAGAERLEAAVAALAEGLATAARQRGVTVSDPAGAVAELERLSAAAQADAGSARTRAAAVADKLALRRRLEIQIGEQREQAQVLEVLGRELRADRFLEFVIQETLDLLAERASEELRRISDGRYSLLSSGGEFAVVDHLNADEQRSVKTLSGGETFMASLALALALSQHVSDLAGEGLGARLEAVFIDEGFGSLDPETLDEVVDALERLRDAELLVGVISHVPEVAARIGDGLDVQRDGNRSSVLPRVA